MNPADTVLIVILAVILAFAVISCIRRRKKGGCGCGCSCADCKQCKAKK